MALDTAWVHVFHLFWPAGCLAALLAPALIGHGPGRQRPWWRQLGWAWAALTLLGAGVLGLGLWWTGRDGRMLTYAALVLVQAVAVASIRSRWP
jgi:hypothetical protein